MITRTHAIELINQHVTTDNIKKHLYATEALMRALARKFNEDEDRWGIAGLLHDLDWDITKPDATRHGPVAYEMLKDEDMDEEMRTAIHRHNWTLNITPETVMEKALYSTEAMTGFIVAVTLMQPTRKLADVSIESIMKKFRTPKFASGVNRDIIGKCQEFLEISVEELTQICLESMREISSELGL